MSRPKTAKKGDRDAAPVVEAGQVNVKFTLDFTATPTPFIAPPSNAYDTRLIFTLLTASAVTSPPTSVWSPAATPAVPAAVRWTTDVELAVGRDAVLAMETGMLNVTVEQRTAHVASDPPPSSEEPMSPSKPTKSVKPPITNKKPKAADKLAGAEEGDRRSTAHPALTDDLPFTPAACFSLPLSTLLAPPHSVAFSSAARTAFVLPAGLSSLSCSLHTSGTNPIHSSLLPTLLPLAMSLTSLTSLPLPAAPSPYRPLSLSFTLPSHPHTFEAPSLLPLSSADLTLQPTLSPTRVVLLGRLSRSALYEASRSDSCGVRVEVRDREHTAIKTKEEVQEEERKQREADEQREAEERERQKEEDKKKKSTKPAATAIKSPKAATKPTTTKADEAATLTQAATAAEVVQADEAAVVAAPPAVVLDCRSNVYGVALLSLVELFQLSVAAAATVDVVSCVSAVLPPADVPLLAPDRRTNPYTGTLLAARLRLLHPLPPVAQLAAEAKYARAVAVWPEDNEDSWLRVYSEVLRLNAQAVRVEDGESEGQGSWQWLEAIKADEQPQPAQEPEQKEEDVRSDKEKDKAKAVKGKKELKPADTAASSSSAPSSPLPPAPRTLPPLARQLQADHITGCVLMDGRSRWLFIEGLADGDAWKAMEAALIADKKTVQTCSATSSTPRVMLDSSLRFTTRSFAGCPLSLSTVQLTGAVSSLQVKAALASTCVLTLSSLSALLAPHVLPDLKAACRTNGWLDAVSVRALRERVGREPKLEEVYGRERGKRERERRKRRAREAREKEDKERAEADRLELEKQQQQNQPMSPGGSTTGTEPQQQPQTQQKPAASATETPAPTDAQPAQDTAAEAQQPIEPTQPATETLPATAATDVAEATLLAGTIERKRNRTSAVPQPAPATLPTYTYSNSAEYQAALRSLRAACHADKRHHYTFHLQYLHSSVPVCESVDEADKEERRQQRRKWRTDRGFVMPPSRIGQLFSHFGLLSEGEREKERNERRRTKTVDELVDAAWHAKLHHHHNQRETNFYTQPLFPSLFDRAPQRSVHLSGVEQVAAERRRAERERGEWEAKVCVDDTAFHVLWGSGQNKVVNSQDEEKTQAMVGGCRLFGLRGLRKDEPVKQSLQFKRQMDGHGQPKPKQKQLVVEDLPVSITNVGEWHGGPSAMQFRDSEKREGQAEFVRYVFPHPFIHKPHIQP